MGKKRNSDLSLIVIRIPWRDGYDAIYCVDAFRKSRYVGGWKVGVKNGRLVLLDGTRRGLELVRAIIRNEKEWKDIAILDGRLPERDENE